MRRLQLLLNGSLCLFLTSQLMARVRRRSITFFGDDKQLPPFGSELTHVCCVFDSHLVWHTCGARNTGKRACGAAAGLRPASGQCIKQCMVYLMLSRPFYMWHAMSVQQLDVKACNKPSSSYSCAWRRWLVLLRVVIPSIQLDTSYRLPPQLCAFLSQHVYQNTLTSDRDGDSSG